MSPNLCQEDVFLKHIAGANEFCFSNLLTFIAARGQAIKLTQLQLFQGQTQKDRKQKTQTKPWGKKRPSFGHGSGNFDRVRCTAGSPASSLDVMDQPE